MDVTQEEFDYVKSKGLDTTGLRVIPAQQEYKPFDAGATIAQSELQKKEDAKRNLEKAYFQTQGMTRGFLEGTGVAPVGRMIKSAIDPNETWEQARNKAKASVANISSESPEFASGYSGGSIMGAIAGGAASGLIPAVGVAKLAPIVSKAPVIGKGVSVASSVTPKFIKGIGQSTATGTAYSAADQFVRDGSVDPEQLKSSALLSAGAGVVTPILNATGKVLSGAKDFSKQGLKEAAEIGALQATGMNKSQAREMLKPADGFADKRVENIGRKLLDKKIVAIGKSKTDVLEGAKKYLDDTGSQIKEMYKTYKNATTPTDLILKRFQESSSVLKNAKLAPQTYADDISKFQMMSRELASASENGQLSVEKLKAIRDAYKDKIWKPDGTIRDGQEVTRELYGYITDAIDDAVTRANPKAGETLKTLRKDYSDLAIANKMYDSEIIKEAASGKLDVLSSLAGSQILSNTIRGSMDNSLLGVGILASKYAAENNFFPFRAAAMNNLSKIPNLMDSAVKKTSQITGVSPEEISKNWARYRDVIIAVTVDDMARSDEKFRNALSNAIGEDYNQYIEEGE